MNITSGARLELFSGVGVDTKNCLQKEYRDVFEQHEVWRTYILKAGVLSQQLQ